MSYLNKSYTDNIMYTPRTPTTRMRQRFNQTPRVNADDDEDEDALEALTGLLKTTWNLWSVSALFEFEDRSERQLKRYGKRLREEIATILPKENATYEANFSIEERISPRPSAADPPPIKIEVFAQNLEKDDVEQCVYSGILLSWGTAVAELDHEQSVKLPLLLCKGKKHTIKAVHTILGGIFDCTIVALSATEEDLQWLLPVMLTPTLQGRLAASAQVCMEYQIPGRPTTNNIVMKFPYGTLVELWSKILEPDDENVVQLKHVERFSNILERQMLIGSGLTLGFCKLVKIHLPVLVAMDNRIKISNLDVLHKVLLFFNEKSIEILHKLNLDSTVSTNTAVT